MNEWFEGDATVEALRSTAKALAGGKTDRTARLSARVADLVTAPVRVALAGEFSSGKSSLVNLLVGENVIKATATASTLPTVMFRHAETPRTRAIWPDGTVRDWDGTAVSPRDTEGAERIIVGLDRPILKRFEFLDTPGTSDPSRDEDQIEHIARQAHMVLWCTNGAQAWRETERRLWTELPKRLQKTSILVVTHVDMPRVAKAVDRLMKRLNKEALPLFQDVVPLGTPLAMDARDTRLEVTDARLWKASGAEALMAALNASGSAIKDAHRLGAQAMLENRIGKSVEESPRSKKKAEAQKVATVGKAHLLTQSWLSHLAALHADIRRAEKVNGGEVIARCHDIVRTFVDTEISPVRAELSTDEATFFAEFERAGSAIDKAAEIRNQQMGANAAVAVLAQLGREATTMMH